MQPSISIIIPSKNEKQNLPRLLSSIRKAQPPPKEVIVVDNHSTDGTRKIAKDVWVKIANTTSPPLRILTKGKERSQQRNAGAKMALGTHLLFLDADMELPRTLLEKLQHLISLGAEAVAIEERAVGHDFWGKAVALERNCYRGQQLLEAPRLIEAKTFKRLGGFDPMLVAGEDWDLYQRLKNHGVQIIHTNVHLIHHEASGFLPNLKRKWYYTQHIQGYARKHPNRFAKQADFKTRMQIFWAARQKLLKNPAHALAFLLLKTVIYLRFRLTQ